MPTQVYQITHYRAEFAQSLRKVIIHSPSIVQILSGKKTFFTLTSHCLTQNTLLLCSAHSQWQFTNLPGRKSFLSRQFIFYLPPSPELLQLSQKMINKDKEAGYEPILKMTKALEKSLNMLAEFDALSISAATSSFLLSSLYQQLAEAGVLHKLFSSTKKEIRHKLVDYFWQDPSKTHEVEQSARHLSMSRATLLRRLKQEQASYSKLLLEVRLNHALSLMQQKPMSVVELAAHCGYQSVARFTQRFEQQYGLSPSAYMQTLW